MSVPNLGALQGLPGLLRVPLGAAPHRSIGVHGQPLGIGHHSLPMSLL